MGSHGVLWEIHLGSKDFKVSFTECTTAMPGSAVVWRFKLGEFWGGPNNKDYSILGSILGPPT